MSGFRFRTEINVPAARIKLDPERPAVLLGSCFTEAVGKRMRRSRWKALVNPGGVLFNPVSVATHLQLALSAMQDEHRVSEIVGNTIFERDGICRSMLFDSTTAAMTHGESLRKGEHAIAELSKGLSRADALFLTFGTSIVYNLKGENPYTVANCHKLPADNFERVMLSSHEIFDLWSELLPRLLQINPKLKIIFTVSPVRHEKDGFHTNTLSKANLMTAIDMLCRNFDNCRYFPAYEIMMDDLRDYRFYASDLVHPSEEAADYIWMKFKESQLTEAGAKLLDEGERLTRREEHRPIIADNPQAGKFYAETKRLAEEFSKAHPGML